MELVDKADRVSGCACERNSKRLRKRLAPRVKALVEFAVVGELQLLPRVKRLAESALQLQLGRLRLLEEGRLMEEDERDPAASAKAGHRRRPHRREGEHARKVLLGVGIVGVRLDRLQLRPVRRAEDGVGERGFAKSCK